MQLAVSKHSGLMTHRKSLHSIHFVKIVFYISVYIGFVSTTLRYYGSYLSYGTGDTIVYVFHNHGGPRIPHRKWIVECLDGEALVGIQDFQDDFERLQTIWCKFVFPFKPPSTGLYPYYPSCVVRNITSQHFCYDARNGSLNVNSFVTALWDSENMWFVWRPGNDDDFAMKCCTVPKGYFIDYVSCYYMPTHDEFGEYYDAHNQVLVACGHSYVVTGMARKLDSNKQTYIVDWIQCCRLSYGAPSVVSPPRVELDGGYPTYIARENYIPSTIPSGYHAQYRSVYAVMADKTNRTQMTPSPTKRVWRRGPSWDSDEHSLPPKASSLTALKVM